MFNLTKKEFILIKLLILNGNTIYSNDRIINYLWEDYSDFDIQIINLKNIISRLR
ncbi:helix-turn-helix domain-containing protein, partial [Aliarcobacter cryaerophilus]|uniref:helix-turn-helix domain-containing protein n=1 Tax=Aliarcobacter cryaerophilus TaxID=28198 RepID=UPI003DA36079